MKKIYKIIFFMMIFMMLPINSNAEEVTCEYIANFSSWKAGDVRINFSLVYDENDFSYKLTYEGGKLNYRTNVTFTYDELMDIVDKNTGSGKCPYKFNGTISNGGSTGNVISVGDSSVDNLNFVCTNCSDGLGNMVIFDPKEYTTCEGILGTRLVNFINTIFNYVKVLVPVALIALGSFDIGRAVFAGNEDEMKKATKTFIRRLIIAVIIMFSPLLVNFIINVVNNATGTGYSGTCGIN